MTVSRNVRSRLDENHTPSMATYHLNTTELIKSHFRCVPGNKLEYCSSIAPYITFMTTNYRIKWSRSG